MPSATIKLFLIHGDSKRLRTAELSNWSGKAIAAPRTEMDKLLAREELLQSGIYILTGFDSDNGTPMAYIGESEVLKARLKGHRNKEFWLQATVFVSKDENLTKSHIRYLEGRLIEEAIAVGRFELNNEQSSGSRLPESDREDIEVFLSKIRQLLPVLGTELLTPVVEPVTDNGEQRQTLYCKIKGLEGRRERTSSGFVVFKGSQAVLVDRPSTKKQHPYIVSLREKMANNGVLSIKQDKYIFTKDVEFTSPSLAASIINGGGTNGMLAWKNASGETLKSIES